MTREKLLKYMPKNNIEIFYQQWVCWHSSLRGENSKRFCAYTKDDLKNEIKQFFDHAKKTQEQGIITNIEYGKLYIQTIEFTYGEVK